MDELPQENSYTYEDLLSWDEPVRYELYDGQLVTMDSPTESRQTIIGEIFVQLHTYLKAKKCRVYFAPFDVRLFEKLGDDPKNVKTVVQPDLMVVCDPSKIDQRGIRGAPDLVVEIISPTTQRYDRLVKLNLYQRAGVKEYWIVDPEYRSVQVLTLTNGLLLPYEIYGEPDTAKIGVLEDCEIDLSAVFPTQE